MRIHVHVERIVLDGLPLSWKDTTAVRLAVQRELANSLRVPGVTPSNWKPAHVPRVDAGSIPLARKPAPGVFGLDLARSLGDVIRK
jgi:hypothetical protein